MKKLITLMVTFILLLTTIGCPVALATETNLTEITVEHADRRTYALSAEVSGDESNYTFIAASYDDSSKLVDVKLLPATVEEGVASATAKIDDKICAQEAESTKFMLWNMDAYKPLAPAAVKTYDEVTNVASGKSVYGTGSANAGLINYTATTVTDGNEETYTGFYASFGLQGYMYLDLGQAYKIDRIEVLGYTNNAEYGARAGHYDVLVSKEKPDLAPPFEEGAQAGEVVVATREESATINTTEFRKTFAMPAGNEEYRYVSLEKLYNEFGDYTNWEGLLVAEVKVYVLTEDVPEPVNYVEVAAGKSTGGYQYDATNQVWESSLMYPASGLVDGAEDGMAGFYISRLQGLMYIDLGQAYEIDHIEVLAYNGGSYTRCGDYNIIAGSKVPDTTAYTADNTIGEVLVASVPQDSTAGSIAVGYKTFYMPEDGSSYRFISFEKLQEGSAGLLMQEVKVYVREENMPAPIEYVEVAKNKPTGGACVETGDIVNVTSGLVDGDINTVAGFYYNRFTGNMFVDLQDAYEIDHIKVLSYNANYVDRARNYDVVASNYVEKGILCTDPNKVVVASRVSSPATTGNADTAQWQTFYMPENSGKHRFVSIEKSVNDGTGLLVAEVEVYVRKDNMTEAAATYTDVTDLTGVTAYGWEDGTSAYNFTNGRPATNAIDNDMATEAGFFFSNTACPTGYIYIDLGVEQQIEYIEVLAYNQVRPRNFAEYNLILSNEVPDKNAYDSENPNGELLLATAGYNQHATSEAKTAQALYGVPAGSGKYRYVSLEKLVNSYTGIGLSVNEVRVYVKTENVEEIPISATNVALGRTADNWVLSKALHESYATLANTTDGKYFSTFGSAIAISRPSWLVLDLGASYDLEKLVLDFLEHANTANNSKSVTVYIGNTPVTSDAEFSAAEKTKVYESGADGTDKGVTTINLETPVRGRYVMIHAATNSVAGDYFWLAELEAWGK